MNKNLRLALAGAFLTTALATTAFVAIGCGADAASPNSEQPTATPEWNVQKEYQPTEVPVTPAPTQAPVETPAAVDGPAEDPAPAEAPRVLWMRTSHAGPGVVTVRFETNVPTTAEVRAMTNQVGPAAFFTEDLDELATAHATSVPASAFGRYQVRVEDEQGNVAWGEMRFKSDPQGIDWATGAAAPTLKAPAAKQLDIAYAFPSGHPTKMGFDGSVHVFMTDITCTTADACVGDLVGSALESPATGNAQLESHKAVASIPGSAFNYQVVIGQPLNPASSTMVFIQLEIRGDHLPKNNISGPGSIKSN